jgi:proteasome lid subunit RPN8/RPN11
MNQSFYTSEANWQKLHDYAQVAYDKHKSEIGGMLVAVEDKDGDWILEDPVILKQEISHSNCVLDKDALAIYYTKAGVKHKDSNFRFVWWHSHHTMDAFWSGTDLTAIKEYSDGDFSFALVINLKGKHIFRVSSWKPFEMHVDTKVELLDGEERKIPKKILNDVEKLCTKPVYNYKTYQYGKVINTANPKQTSLIKPTNVDSDMEARRAIELVTSLNYRFAAGELTFKEWVRVVESYNLKMDDWYIDDVISEEQLKKDVIHRKSEDFLEPLYSDADMATMVDDQKVEEAKDEWYFNQSYGGIY